MSGAAEGMPPEEAFAESAYQKLARLTFDGSNKMSISSWQSEFKDVNLSKVIERCSTVDTGSLSGETLITNIIKLIRPSSSMLELEKEHEVFHWLINLIQNQDIEVIAAAFFKKNNSGKSPIVLMTEYSKAHGYSYSFAIVLYHLKSRLLELSLANQEEILKLLTFEPFDCSNPEHPDYKYHCRINRDNQALLHYFSSIQKPEPLPQASPSSGAGGGHEEKYAASSESAAASTSMIYTISLRKAYGKRSFDSFLSALIDDAKESVNKLSNILGTKGRHIKVMLTSYGDQLRDLATNAEKSRFETKMQALVEELTGKYGFDICLAPGTISFRETTAADSLCVRAYLFVANQEIQFRDESTLNRRLFRWGEQRIAVYICADLADGSSMLDETPDIYYITSSGFNLRNCNESFYAKPGTLIIYDDNMHSRDVSVFKVEDSLPPCTFRFKPLVHLNLFAHLKSVPNDQGLPVFATSSRDEASNSRDQVYRTSSIFGDRASATGTSKTHPLPAKTESRCIIL